jgi:hypothetical protein
MSSLSFSNALRSSRAQKIIDAINAGAGPGTIKFYDSPRPVAGGAITTQTLGGTLTFSEPAGTISNGVLTFNTITEDSLVDATIYCRWARILDGDGVWVADADISELDGKMYLNDGSEDPLGPIDNAPIRMTSVLIYIGGALRISSAAMTEGNA